MTCKDCIHYDVCHFHITEETNMTVNECSHAFKDKSKIIELPCKVGDKVYLVEATGLFDNNIFVVTGFEINSDSDNTYRAVCEFEGRLVPLIFNDKNIGKTVFFTKEEAEKALEAKKNEG